MRLVVTEKPAVARDLARALGIQGRRDGWIEGDGVRITWCRGHLLELADPDHYDPDWKPWRAETLPMVPDRFALRVRQGAEQQWAVVERLMRDRGVSEVINACDAGREGELIFRYAYDHAGCAHPVRRLWTSSLTDDALKDAWARLRDGTAYDPLADAARCRSEADWLVGMNATRALTLANRAAGGDALLSVGRVQTPTLAMIVGRDAEIEAFVPETYWRLKATLHAEAGAWTGTFTREPASDVDTRRGVREEDTPGAERLGSAEEAAQVADAIRDREGTVVTARRREHRERPPLLYDLTSLQRRANQRYGLSAQRTLEVAQALYERHKLLTYPRTDARHLTRDVAAELPDVVRGVGRLPVYAQVATDLLSAPLRLDKRVVDDAEVGDHHAILPTGRTPDPSRLSADEKRVFDLVVRRLLAALSADARFALATLVVAVSPDPGRPLPATVTAPVHLQARGRVCLDPGWQAVDPPKKRSDKDLPVVEADDPVRVGETETPEGCTRPPRPYDDASILKAMETAGRSLDEAALRRALRGAGLGTPATRASILQTLLDRRYVVREGKALRATDAGKALIEVLPADELRSAELTGRWEQRLTDMAEGRESRAAFMRDVAEHLHGLVSAIATAPMVTTVAGPAREQGPSLGACPACGTPVRARGPVYTCETGRSCPFVVFATMSGRSISVRMVKALLKDGRSPVVKGFKSRRTGKAFEAGLMVRDDHTVGLWFPDAPEAPSRAPAPDRSTDRAAGRGEDGGAQGAPPGASDPVGMACPACGEGHLVAGRAAWGCSRWRDGCGWRLPFEASGRRLQGAEAVDRVRRAQRAAEAGRSVDTSKPDPR